MLPFENTIYLADSKNAPYGEKSKDDILRLSIKNTEVLLKNDCKLVVVACNTATTNAIDYLRKNYDVPFIGIEPAIKPAALQSKTKTVGVLATKGTLASSLFHSTSEIHASGINVIVREGTGLVQLIEEGKVDSQETRKLLLKHVRPMIDEGIDYLVLGCTHYPYLVPILKEILPESVQIIDSGEAVARQTKSILNKNGLLASQRSKAYHRFYTNANIHVLESFVMNGETDYNVSVLDF